MAYAQILLEKEENGKVKQKLSGIGVFFPLILPFLFLITVIILTDINSTDLTNDNKKVFALCLLINFTIPYIYLIIKKDFFIRLLEMFLYQICILLITLPIMIITYFFVNMFYLFPQNNSPDSAFSIIFISLLTLLLSYYAKKCNEKHLSYCIKKGYKIKTIKIMPKSIFYLYSKYINNLSHEEITTIIKKNISAQISPRI